MKAIFYRVTWSGLILIALAAGAAAQDDPSAGPHKIYIAPDAPPAVPVTDAERAAVRITATSLDCLLVPALAREEVHATLTVRNDSAAPVSRIPLQISGSLRWISVTAGGAHGFAAAPFTQSPVATDTDHTGFAQELVLTPAVPLGAGESLTLSAQYDGEIRQSSARLNALGADPGTAAQSEWDAITPTSDAGATALRGFGNVLWYPVSAPTAALGDGNRLFELVAHERRRNADASFRLHLIVEYLGDPPNAAIVDGQLVPLAISPDEQTTLVDDTRGVATAEVNYARLGDRSPSLFLTAQRAATTPDQLLSFISPVPELAEPYAAAAAALAPLLTSWLGATPTQPLLLLDHPGAPFEDAGFVAAHLSSAAEPARIAPELIRGLTHAWYRAATNPQNLWFDHGLADFMSLLWTERSLGRDAALDQLRQAAIRIALAEPDLSTKDHAPGEPLTSAYSDVYLRLKAAAVFWQLRDIVGEERLQKALAAYRHASDTGPNGFEQTLERVTGTDLTWFFADWVYRDQGLPDLSITRVNARPQLTSKSQVEGYLVAIEVRNDGDAVADVPVVVRSGNETTATSASETTATSATSAIIKERIRVAAHASASVRIFFQGRPETVEVNDGSVPEMRTTSHSAPIELTK